MKKIISLSAIFIIIHLGLIWGAFSSPRSFNSGNLAHIVAFFAIGFIIYLLLEELNIPYPAFGTLVYISIVAVLIEVIQGQLSYRQFSEKDILFDLIGSGISVIINESRKKIKN